MKISFTFAYNSTSSSAFCLAGFFFPVTWLPETWFAFISVLVFKANVEFPYCFTTYASPPSVSVKRSNGILQLSLLLTFRSHSSLTMDNKQFLSASGYNLHGSSYSINLQTVGTAAGYKGSNEFICKYFCCKIEQREYLNRTFYLILT